MNDGVSMTLKVVLLRRRRQAAIDDERAPGPSRRGTRTAPRRTSPRGPPSPDRRLPRPMRSDRSPCRPRRAPSRLPADPRRPRGSRSYRHRVRGAGSPSPRSDRGQLPSGRSRAEASSCSHVSCSASACRTTPIAASSRSARGGSPPSVRAARIVSRNAEAPGSIRCRSLTTAQSGRSRARESRRGSAAPPSRRPTMLSRSVAERRGSPG